MHGKGNVETYITACKIDSQQGFSVQLRKLKVGLCVPPTAGASSWGGGHLWLT